MCGDKITMITQITDLLYVGDGQDATLYHSDYDMVVTIAEQTPYRGDIQFNIVDDAIESNKNLFRAAIITVNFLVRQGLKTLVHCNDGMSRSVAVCVGHVVCTQLKDVDIVIAEIKKVRPHIDIHPYFIKLLKTSRQDMLWLKKRIRQKDLSVDDEDNSEKL